MKDVVIYTDGSCHGNPGPGGYAAIVLQNGMTKEVRGSDWYTTNNRMELMAVIEGLKLIGEPSHITIITDSKYVANQINRGNLRAFIRQPDRKNVDLWQIILRISELHHSLKAKWVKGHAGDKLNQRCDSLANMEARRVKEETEVRTFVFSELLLDVTASPEAIAKKYGQSYPIDTVQKYYKQFFDKQATAHSQK